jgi:hypothetical protein
MVVKIAASDDDHSWSSGLLRGELEVVSWPMTGWIFTLE